MIVFDLKCKNRHRFEGWFEDTAAYKSQKEDGMIACPICADTNIVRVPSTFAIKTSSNRDANPATAVKAQEMGKKIAEFVEKNFEDVGCDFAREALKIHYGAEEPRNIRGVSTDEEEKVLKKEGVDFFKFPMPSED